MKWLLALALTGCAAAPPARAAQVRAHCGWDTLSPATVRVRVAADGSSDGPLSGHRVLAIDAPEATYGAVKPVLNAPGLVRVKVLLGDDLLPLTIPAAPGTRKKEMAGARVTVVGSHRIHRPKGTVSQRFASMRLDGDRVYLCLESESCKWMGLNALAAALEKTHPKAEVFSLSASDPTPWRHLVTALATAACYDRRPGEEPHEVLSSHAGKQ